MTRRAARWSVKASFFKARAFRGMLARRALTLHSRTSLLMCREYADGSGAYVLLHSKAAVFGIYPQEGARLILECEYTPGSQLRDTSQLGSGLYKRIWDLAREAERKTGEPLEPLAPGETLLYRPPQDLLQAMYGAALPVVSIQSVRGRGAAQGGPAAAGTQGAVPLRAGDAESAAGASGRASNIADSAHAAELGAKGSIGGDAPAIAPAAAPMVAPVVAAVSAAASGQPGIVGAGAGAGMGADAGEGAGGGAAAGGEPQAGDCPDADPGLLPDTQPLSSPTLAQIRGLLPDPSIAGSGAAITGALLDENGCLLVFLETAKVNFVIRIPPHNQHLFSVGIRTLSPYATEKREVHALRMFHFDALRYSNACTNNGLLVVGYGLSHCLNYELISTPLLRYLLPPVQKTDEALNYQNLKIPGLDFPSGGVFRRFYLVRSDRNPTPRTSASAGPGCPGGPAGSSSSKAAQQKQGRAPPPVQTKYDLLHSQQPFQMPMVETELDRCCGAAALDYRCLPEVFLSDERTPQLAALTADLGRAAMGELLGLQMYTVRPVPPRKISFVNGKDSLFTVNVITGSAGTAAPQSALQKEAHSAGDAAALNKLLQVLPHTRQSVKPDVSTYLALFDSSDALLGSLINRAYRDHNITGVYCRAHDVGLTFDEMLKRIRKLVKAKIYNSVISCLNCNFLVCVTGSPGSGKTSLVKAFLDEDIACSGQEDTFTSVDRVVRYLGGNYSHPFAIDFEDLLLQLSRCRLRAIQLGNYFSFFEGQLSCYDPSVLGSRERALALNLYTNLPTAHYRKFGNYSRDKADKAFISQAWPCYLWYRDSILGVAKKSIVILDCETTMRNLLALYGWLLTVLGNVQERHCAFFS